MTLFQKYGGTPTVSRLVANFYQEVLARPHLKRHFDGVPLPKLIQHQVRFISGVLGQSPSPYNGRTMAEAHDRLKISAEDFAEVAQIFSDTLSKAGVEPADLQKVMADVATLESAVVARATD
jgi:hemoglobin